MDFNRVLDAAKMIIVIALVFNLAMIGIGAVLDILGFGAGTVAKGNSQTGVLVGLGGGLLLFVANWGLKIVIALGNVIIFAYGGFSAAKKGNDLVGCGMVGLVTYALVGLICGVIQLVLTFLGIGATVATSGSAMAGLFSGLMGAMGLGMGLVCGVFWYFGGLVTNFIVALVGGLVGGAK